MTCFLVLFAFYLHYHHLLSTYKILLLIQQILSSFLYLIPLLLTQLYFIFFLLVMVIIWSIKYSSNNFCNFFINFICFYVYSETIYILMPPFYFYIIFPFGIIMKKSYIIILLNSDIESRKEAGLLICISVYFISIANKLSV